MIDSVVKNLPQPVVIVKQKGADGKLGKGRVILSPKKQPAEYGDLLDKYEKPPPEGYYSATGASANASAMASASANASII